MGLGPRPSAIRSSGWFLLACLLVFPVSLRAQGVMGAPVVLRANDSEPLQTESRSALLPGDSVGPVVELHFGFETDETFGPNTIFDSFSVTVANAVGDQFAVLFTADVSGVVYAPATPGALTLPSGAVTASLIPVPALNPNLTRQYAARVLATLPTAFAGQQATFYFDLFDNQNGIASQGWFADLAVVPEPSAFALLGLGALLLWWRMRIRS